MDYKEFLKLLKQENINNIYLFSGKELYLMDNTLEQLKKQYISELTKDLNYIFLENSNLDFKDIFECCETLPFMSKKRVVVIRNISELLANSKDDINEKLSNYITKLPIDIIFIIMDKNEKLDKRTMLYKACKNNNCIVEFKKVNNVELTKWVLRKFNDYNKKIANKEVEEFINLSGYFEYGSSAQLYDLENEIKKIAAVAEEVQISVNDIESVMSLNHQKTIFKLMDAIAVKNTETGYSILNELISTSVPIQKILYMIIRQMRLIKGVKNYKKLGLSDKEIQSNLKISYFEAKKLLNQCDNFSYNYLNETMGYLIELDYKQKTQTYNERIGIEILMTKLTLRI